MQVQPSTDKKAVDMDQTIINLNIKRIYFVAIVFALFQIVNLIGCSLRKDPLLFFGCGFGVLLNAISVGLITAYRRRIQNNHVLARFIYIAYWCAMVLAMCPFFVHDIQNAQAAPIAAAPINIALFTCLMLIVPIFRRWEFLVAYTFFFLVNIAIFLLYKAPPSFYFFLCGMTATALILSHSVQQQYIKMIDAANAENRKDVLTGIYNRRGGLEKMRLLMDMNRRYNGMLAIYMIDIDYFKNYNDAYGHVAGDKALCAVAEAIHSVLLRNSDMICRYGGEEFSACAIVRDETEAASIAERMLSAVRALKITPACRDSYEWLSISVGCICRRILSDSEIEDEAVLLEEADKALYLAKTTGRNKAVVI